MGISRMRGGWWTALGACCAAALVSCADSRVAKGDMALRLGDYRMALQFYQEELLRRPQSFDARLGMGKALLQQAADHGDDTASWRAALTNLEAARALRPGEPIEPLLAQAWTVYGRRTLGQGDTMAGLQALARAIEYDPRNAEALNLAGIVYFRQGQPVQAAALFANAVAADSCGAVGYFNLGMVRWHEGDVAAAHRLWLAALRRDSLDSDLLYWFARAEKALREQP